MLTFAARRVAAEAGRATARSWGAAEARREPVARRLPATAATEAGATEAMVVDMTAVLGK